MQSPGNFHLNGLKVYTATLFSVFVIAQHVNTTEHLVMHTIVCAWCKFEKLL